MKSKSVLLAFIAVGLALSVGGILKGQELVQDARIVYTSRQIKAYSKALAAFQKQYHALPGDMANAGSKLKGCTGDKGGDCNPAPATAGDSIIGNPDFIKTLKPQITGITNVPAVTAGDESVLFWTHLHLAGLITDVTDDGLQNGSKIEFGTLLPESRYHGGLFFGYDSGFIVGYSDGTSVPPSLSPPNTIFKGTIVAQISSDVLSGAAEPNAPDQQALTPLRAAQIDRKMDDGRPLTGYVRGYGAPGCMNAAAEVYNEQNGARDCNLIYFLDGFRNDP